MSIRILLIILIVLSWAGGIHSIVVFSATAGRIQWGMVGWAFVIVAANVLCARYLYHNAVTRKTEWALFGFLGNIYALSVYWVAKAFRSH
jgi:hypothetical protein